jgi:hypothetical protein
VPAGYHVDYFDVPGVPAQEINDLDVISATLGLFIVEQSDAVVIPSSVQKR